jgi:hypothetical protein
MMPLASVVMGSVIVDVRMVMVMGVPTRMTMVVVVMTSGQ